MLLYLLAAVPPPSHSGEADEFMLGMVDLVPPPRMIMHLPGLNDVAMESTMQWPSIDK